MIVINKAFERSITLLKALFITIYLNCPFLLCLEFDNLEIIKLSIF